MDLKLDYYPLILNIFKTVVNTLSYYMQSGLDCILVRVMKNYDFQLLYVLQDILFKMI